MDTIDQPRTAETQPATPVAPGADTATPTKKSPARPKPQRVPLGPTLTAAGLLVGALALVIGDVLGWLWAAVILGGAAVLGIGGWLLIRRGGGRRGKPRARTGGAGGGLWPGRSPRSSRTGRSSGRSATGGRSGGQAKGLRSKLPRALGGTRASGAAGGMRSKLPRALGGTRSSGAAAGRPSAARRSLAKLGLGRTGSGAGKQSSAGGSTGAGKRIGAGFARLTGRKFTAGGSGHRGGRLAGLGRASKAAGSGSGSSGARPARGKLGGLLGRGKNSSGDGSPTGRKLGGLLGGGKGRTGGNPGATTGKLAGVKDLARDTRDATRKPAPRPTGAASPDPRGPVSPGQERPAPATPKQEPSRPVNDPPPKTEGQATPPSPRHAVPTQKPEWTPPAPRQGGKTMTDSHVGRHTEGMSLYGWGESLKAVPDVLGEFAKQFEALATQAEDEQPAAAGLSERIRAIAATIRRCETEAGDLHPTFRREHETDVERVENPRKGSTHIEQRADVGRAQRDM